MNFSYYGIYYCLTTYSEGNGVVTVENNGSFNTYSGTVNIPDSVPYQNKYYPVTGIGYQAFKDCVNLTAVTLPEGISMLLNEAFAGCTSLGHITLPSTMYTIYNNAFTGCTNLEWIACLSENARSCNTNNFDASTYANTRLYVPQGSLSSYQSTSAWSQFADIAEKNLFVVDGIYYKRISSNTAAVTYRDDDYNSYQGNWYYIPSHVTYGGVTYTVTQIDAFAFSNSRPVRGFINVSAPNTVTMIKPMAFSNSYLNSLELGTGVTSIGEQAFSGCNQFNYLSIKAKTPPTIQSNTFPNNTMYNEEEFILAVPRQDLAAYRSATHWSNFAPENVWTIADFLVDGISYQQTSPTTVEVAPLLMRSYSTYFRIAPEDMPSVESIAIPATINVEGTTYDVTSIGSFGCAFWERKNISLPNSIKTIGDLAFYRCDSLASINLPEGLTSIGILAFYYCTKIESVNIPNSVKTIAESAFWRCDGLKTLTLGRCLELIGFDAFTSCDSITSVTCYAPVPPAVSYPPDNYQILFDLTVFANATLHVRESSLEAYKTARGWEKFSHVETFVTLDDALNVPGGTLHFESDCDYPWEVTTQGDRMFAMPSNAGVANSTSTLSTTVTLASKTTLSFDFKAWGEGSDTAWDACVFAIDGQEQFRYGALQNDWETYSVEIPAGTHTLTWSYSKDGSVNPDGDYFAVDNVSLGKNGDVNGDSNVNIADVTALIDYLLSGDTTGINLASADCNNDSNVNIADVTALIDYLLSGAWAN